MVRGFRIERVISVLVRTVKRTRSRLNNILIDSWWRHAVSDELSNVYTCSGCCHEKPLLVPGGRVFVWPTVQKIQRLVCKLLVVIQHLSIEMARNHLISGHSSALVWYRKLIKADTNLWWLDVTPGAINASSVPKGLTDFLKEGLIR